MNLSLFEPNAPALTDGEFFRIDQGDAIERLSRLPSGSVNLVITDPAYESLEKHRAKGTTTRLKQSAASSNEWFPIFPNTRFPELFLQISRVLADDSHCYVMCDQETAFAVVPMGIEAGFRFWKPLIWEKQTIGMGYHYRAQYEFVLFFEKGKRKLANLGVGDVLSFPRVRNGYPTEKPVGLSKVLIEQSSLPGDIVVDCFCGSGSVGEAALQSGRRFLGFDLKGSAVELATGRLSALVPDAVEPCPRCEKGQLQELLTAPFGSWCPACSFAVPEVESRAEFDAHIARERTRREVDR